MNISRRKLIAVVGVGLFLASSGVATTAYAAAPDDEVAIDPYQPPFGEPSEVIYIDGPAPKPDEDSLISRSTTSAGDVFVYETEDFPANPAPGETIRIVYTDSVTEVSAAAAGTCTKSISADSPYKSGNRPRANGRGSISAGCGNEGMTLAINNGWDMYATNSWTVYAGGSVWQGSAVGDTCYYGYNTSFYSIAAWSGGGDVWSPTVTLPCRKF